MIWHQKSLALALALALLFAALIPAALHHHTACEDCPICAFTGLLRRGLSLFYALVFPAFAAGIFFCPALLAVWAGFIKTPLFRKERLLN